LSDRPGPPGGEAAADRLAVAWLNADTMPVEPAVAADAPAALALGWALKRAAQRSWHSEPARAHRAAAGLRRLAAAFPALAELAALGHWTAGFAALVDGDMAEALVQLEAAGSRLESLGRPADAAQARLPMLMALSMLGRSDEAVALADALEAPLAAAGDELSAGKVALNRGSMLMRLDRYDAAAEGYRQASAHFARAGDATHGIMADIGLAGALTWRYRFDEAEAIVGAARQQASAQGLHVLEALAAGEIGQLQLHNGRVAAALQAFEQAVRLLTGRAPPQRLLEAERARAEALLAVGLWPEAAAACTRMVEAADAMQAPVEAAWSRMMRGQALGEAGDRPGAEADLHQAAASFERLGNTVGIGRARLLHARLAQAGGEAAHALALAAKAAALLGVAGVTRWRLDAQLLQAGAALALGDVARAQALLAAVAGDAADAPARAACAALHAQAAAQAGDTEQARAYAHDALGRFDQLRRQVPAGDMRIASLHGAEAVADLWVRLNDLPGGAPQALLAAIERGRSRALHDDLARSAEPAPPADNAQAAPRARLSWLQHQWNHALAVGESDPERLAHLQRLVHEAEAQQAHAERLRAAARPVAHAGPGGAAADGTGVSLETVHAQLGPSRALVSFHLDGETWRACVLWRGGCRRLQGQVAGLAGRLASLRLQMDAMRGPAAGHARHAGQRLERVTRLLAGLHDDLVAPWRAAVADADQLVLLPHRALHAIPFAALASGGPPLGAAFELVQAPSLGAWLHCMQLAPRPAGATLALGAGSAWLPGVADEARDVAALYGTGARLLVDDGATLAHWRAEAPGAAVLHLACHARARPDNPAFSALQLADGALTLAEVSATRLRAGLVVLSACDTMISRLAPGDEVLGLARGFLLAGARTVVASLWSVPDGTAAGMMADLHAACARGESPAAALRAARCRLAGQQAHPFHWAPFVAYGAG
jgi:tetratricopeptide (TPR) repeat protein